MDCSEGRLLKVRRLRPTDASFQVLISTLLLQVPSWFVLPYPSLPHPLSLFRLRMPQAGSRGQVQVPSRERRGGHHARDRAGSWRLPPQWPARALPRPGPHAPISEGPLGGVGGRSAKRKEALKVGFAAVIEADGERQGRAKVPLLWGGLRVALRPLAEVGRLWSEGHRCFCEGLKVFRCF